MESPLSSWDEKYRSVGIAIMYVNLCVLSAAGLYGFVLRGVVFPLLELIVFSRVEDGE